MEDIGAEYKKFADLRQEGAGAGRWASEETGRFHPVLQAARKWTTAEGRERDCLELGLHTGTGRGGHSVAFAFRTSSRGTPEIYFFDPNYGEFEFTMEGKGESRLYQFFDDLWEIYALQGDAFPTWQLTAFYKETEGKVEI